MLLISFERELFGEFIGFIFVGKEIDFCAPKFQFIDFQSLNLFDFLRIEINCFYLLPFVEFIVDVVCEYEFVCFVHL